MCTESLRQAARDLHHVRFGAIEAVNSQREIQRLLNLPDFFVLVRRQDRGRVSNSNPTNWNGIAGRDMRFEVHNSVNANFATFSEPSTMEDGGTSSDEDFVFDRTANNVGVRANEAVIANLERVTSVAPKDGVLHHDAFGSDLDRAAFRDNLRTEKNSATRADDDIAAYSRVRCYMHSGVYPWRFALMCDDHDRAAYRRLLSSNNCSVLCTSPGCSTSRSGSHSLRGTAKKSPPYT